MEILLKLSQPLSIKQSGNFPKGQTRRNAPAAPSPASAAHSRTLTDLLLPSGEGKAAELAHGTGRLSLSLVLSARSLSKTCKTGVGPCKNCLFLPGSERETGSERGPAPGTAPAPAQPRPQPKSQPRFQLKPSGSPSPRGRVSLPSCACLPDIQHA